MCSVLPTHGVAAALIFAAGLSISGRVAGAADLYALPAATVSAGYDDNLFGASSDPQQDRFLRITPTVEAGYRSPLVTLDAHAAFDAERYARHTELDDNRAREREALAFHYAHSRTLTLAANAESVKTNTPGELAPAAGLQFGRTRAERRTFNPSLVCRFDERDTGSAAYRSVDDELAGGVGSRTHSIALGFDRHVGERDTAQLRYRYERVHFDDGGAAQAHVLLAGGSHAVTPRTTIDVLIGPRFSHDSIDPDVSAGLRHRFRRGEFDLTYDRSQTTILGVAGTATTQSVAATLVRSAGPSAEVRAAAGYVASDLGDAHADVATFELEARYRFDRSMTFGASYRFGVQRGSLDAAGVGEIRRNVVLFSLTIAAPTRATRPAPPTLPAPSPWVEAPVETAADPHTGEGK